MDVDGLLAIAIAMGILVVAIQKLCGRYHGIPAFGVDPGPQEPL